MSYHLIDKKYLKSNFLSPGPAGWGGAAQGHVPQPRQHRQEAGQWLGHSGGRQPPTQEAGGDESKMELLEG